MWRCGVEEWSGWGRSLCWATGGVPIYIPSRARGRACVPFRVRKSLVESWSNGLFRGIKGVNKWCHFGDHYLWVIEQVVFKTIKDMRTFMVSG